MTILYHGTNQVFKRPNIDIGRDGMDFGKGFYLTPSVESARKMAVRVSRFAGGDPVVLQFAFDEDAARQNKLVHDFPALDRAWVSFIIANRLGDTDAAEHNMDRRYAIVHGPIADDRLMQILDDYENGDLSIDEVEHRLSVAPFRAFQYSFHTEEALSYLSFKGVVK